MYRARSASPLHYRAAMNREPSPEPYRAVSVPRITESSPSSTFSTYGSSTRPYHRSYYYTSPLPEYYRHAPRLYSRTPHYDRYYPRYFHFDYSHLPSYYSPYYTRYYSPYTGTYYYTPRLYYSRYSYKSPYSYLPLSLRYRTHFQY